MSVEYNLLVKITALLNQIEEPRDYMDIGIASDSGHNFDDAFWMGVEQGERSLAKQLRELINDE